MKTTQRLALLTIVSFGLPACAIQGTHSLRPHGITLNRSLRLGADAFEPNPFDTESSSYKSSQTTRLQEDQYNPPSDVISQNTNYVTNNFYSSSEHDGYPDPTNCPDRELVILSPVY